MQGLYSNMTFVVSTSTVILVERDQEQVRLIHHRMRHLGAAPDTEIQNPRLPKRLDGLKDSQFPFTVR